MINKPNNWENVEANYGEGKRLNAGGYICKVMACKVETSKNGKQMLVVNFDIAEGDFKDFYLERYKNAPRDQNNPKEPKWNGKYYLLLEGDGYEGRLKAFTTSIEESNQGYTWDWNEDNLKGKLFGGIFREEEYISNDGTIKDTCKLWQVRSVKTIKECKFEIPRKKEIPSEQFDQAYDFNVKPINDDDLPF
jgi:hypothetical protein